MGWQISGTMRYSFGASLVLAAVFFAASPIRAGTIYTIGQPATMAQLTDPEDDAAIIAGDKKFSHFAYSPVGTDAPSAAEVTVIGFLGDVMQDDAVVQGYGLQFSGGFVADELNGRIIEAGLSFTVEALDQDFLISDVHLGGTAYVSGDGSARIVESFSGVPVNIPDLTISERQFDGQSAPDNTDNASIVFSDAIGVTGFHMLRVTKNIRAQAGDGLFDEAGVPTFYQVFTQTLVVPEPGTLAPMLLGLAGLAFVRRYRR